MNVGKIRGVGAAGLALAAALVATALAGAGAAGTSAPSAQKGKDKKPAAAPSVFVEDRGTLQIQVDGQPAGSEEFEIRSSGGAWTARGTAEVAAENGKPSKVTGKLELTPDGAPLRYEASWTASSPRKVTVEFEGTVAKLEMKLEGAAPFAQDFAFPSPPILILDNNMYHHYAVLARIYDWEHKEQKTYNVLIPQDQTPGTVRAEYGGQQVVDGQKLDVLRVHSTDLEIELYCDNGRLVRLEVPASKAVVVRQPGKK
ncbi:MAG TPA: hypothetical protein VJW51_13990 [Candidatus Acidoferrales bacterium]|nr:hypothetical protein [Candidatus Acidoferrales bacterium]